MRCSSNQNDKKAWKFLQEIAPKRYVKTSELYPAETDNKEAEIDHHPNIYGNFL